MTGYVLAFVALFALACALEWKAAQLESEELTLDEWIAWKWRSLVWYPLVRRCAWCGFKLCADDDAFSIFECEASPRGMKLRGPGRWACYGCTEYPDG